MSSSDPAKTCMERTLAAAVHGAAIGLFISLINSGNDVAVWLEGSNNPTASGLLRMIGSRVGRNIGVFSIGTGLYHGIRCSMEKARGRRDWINAATSGAILGYAWGTRHGPRLAIINATTVGTVCGLYDAIWRSLG